VRYANSSANSKWIENLIESTITSFFAHHDRAPWSTLDGIAPCQTLQYRSGIRIRIPVEIDDLYRGIRAVWISCRFHCADQVSWAVVIRPQIDHIVLRIHCTGDI